MELAQLKEAFLKVTGYHVLPYTDVMVYADSAAIWNWDTFSPRVFCGMAVNRVRLVRKDTASPWQVMAQYKVCVNGF